MSFLFFGKVGGLYNIVRMNGFDVSKKIRDTVEKFVTFPQLSLLSYTDIMSDFKN